SRSGRGWSRGNIVDDRNGDRSEGLALNTHEENRVSRGVYRGDRVRTDVRTNPAGHLDQIGVRRCGEWAKETAQDSVTCPLPHAPYPRLRISWCGRAEGTSDPWSGPIHCLLPRGGTECARLDLEHRASPWAQERQPDIVPEYQYSTVRNAYHI